VLPNLPEADISEYNREQSRKLAAELGRRRMETLSIYEPLIDQENFHKCNAPERLLRGSNRGGKTLAACTEIAWAVTGTHPYLDYPKENGIIYLVGKDLKHVGNVFFKKLFQPGELWMIRDLVTGKWRAYHNWDESDKKRKKERKRSPPLIPWRYLVGGTPKDPFAGVAWENKKESAFTKAMFTTGWEMQAYPAGGAPPRGVSIDVVVFDEHIPHPEWYSEMSARLVDKHGRFIWSATPQSFNPQLFYLSQDALKLKLEHEKDPRIVEFFIDLALNPHITDQAKKLLADKYKNNPEEYRVRILGEFASTGYKIFPNFDIRGIHGIDLDELPGRQIPDDWCRYMVVDPGHNVCAVLFAAVPPDGSKFGSTVIFYDELYLKNCDANEFGKAVVRKVMHTSFETFIIDKHGSRVTSAGDGKRHEEHYEAALKLQGVSSKTTGHGFLAGCSDIMQRIDHCREWLAKKTDGTAKLRVLRGHLPNFESEIDIYHKKRNSDNSVSDKPDPRRKNHLMDCFGYIAAHEPEWHPHKKSIRIASPVYREYENLIKTRKSGKSKVITFS
jgi:hypothetical protein